MDVHSAGVRMIPIAQQLASIRAATDTGMPDGLSEPQRRILQILTRRWMTTAGVVRATGLKDQAARRYLDLLNQRGLVERGLVTKGDRAYLAWRRAEQETNP